MKDCPKPIKTSMDAFSNYEQDPSIHATFSTNTHILLKM